VDTFTDPSDFLAMCGDWLMESEVDNNSILSIVNAIKAGKSAFGKDAWFGTLTDRERVRGCALIVKPDGIVISSLPKDGHEALRKAVKNSGMSFTRISGPFVCAAAFAEDWTAENACEWYVAHEWRSYQVTRVVMPEQPAPGSLRFANQDERDLITEWAGRYEEEKPAPVSVIKFLLYKLDEGELYVWDDNGPKTLVAVSGFTRNCARVSAVFTPKEFRGNGYASIAVAKVSKELLERGLKYATLLVDKKDPAVMRIYEKIGYKRQGSKVNIQLG
jgi:GNAT superfamily N-acetyltransferase